MSNRAIKPSIPAQRIAIMRERSGLTLSELAARLGVREATVQRYETGEIANIKRDTIIDIANALGCSPIYLMGWSDNPDGTDGLTAPTVDPEFARRWCSLDRIGQKAVRAILDVEYERCTRANESRVVPLPTRPIRMMVLPVSAGTGVALADEQTEAIDIPLTDVSRQADFVLQVNGNSMEPRFHDGDLLLIQQTDAVDAGELGVFAVNGEGFFKRAGTGQLESLNPAYKPIRLRASDSVATFGRVLGTTEIVNGEGMRDDE